MRRTTRISEFPTIKVAVHPRTLEAPRIRGRGKGAATLGDRPRGFGSRRAPCGFAEGPPRAPPHYQPET
jgi:hypothetical protein